jgi:prepilin-type N-terminal cleavage/methylation domain-containing protein
MYKPDLKIGQTLKKSTKGFTFIEIMLTMSLFLILAGIGVGAYFKYYSFSLIKNDVSNAMTLIKQTRFSALKNATGSDYGIHIDTMGRMLTGFKGDVYNPSDSENKTVKFDQLNILTLDLNPNIGSTNEIVFQAQTGKTLNYGSFIIGNDVYSYTININPQGVVQ